MLWPLQPPESPQRETGRRGGGGRSRQLRHQAQWPYTPSGVQGAPFPARQGAARPERSLQAWFFRHRTVAAARNRASGFGGDWRVRQQLPVGVGPDDRMPPGQPGAERGCPPPPEIRTTETT
ncbi:hypothetical protein HT118_19875 [Escherichia coli]|nr:hypothetical protein [Escherichia coli]